MISNHHLSPITYNKNTDIQPLHIDLIETRNSDVSGFLFSYI